MKPLEQKQEPRPEPPLVFEIIEICQTYRIHMETPDREEAIIRAYFAKELGSFEPWMYRHPLLAITMIEFAVGTPLTIVYTKEGEKRFRLATPLEVLKARKVKREPSSFGDKCIFHENVFEIGSDIYEHIDGDVTKPTLIYSSFNEESVAPLDQSFFGSNIEKYVQDPFESTKPEKNPLKNFSQKPVVLKKKQRFSGRSRGRE